MKTEYSTLTELFDASCAANPEALAFSSFGRSLNYAELHRLADAFAFYIQRYTDLQPGDRIAIQLPNLTQYPVVLFGALKAGLVVVNTNPLYTSAEMEHQFQDAGVKALVIHKSMAYKAQPILQRTRISHVFVTQVGDMHPYLKRVFLNAAVKFLKHMEPPYELPGVEVRELRDVLAHCIDLQPAPVHRYPEDLAVLQYTGGTTGVAKGAMLSHANLLANLTQAKQRLDMAPQGWAEHVVLPLPLYHIYAFTLSLIVLQQGGHSVLIPNPRDIASLVHDLQPWPFSAFMGLNTLFVALCKDEKFCELDFSTLKLTVSGGMALTRSAAERWQEVTACEVLEGYGLTEASPIVAVNPPGAARLGTIGPPLIETEVELLDEQGTQVPEGMKGELCIRGPQVMKGYWQRPEETAQVMTAEGYLRTGDIARIQPDGYLEIVDRAKDMINVSGFNVYPSEVEHIASQHQNIQECAAIGIADEHTGEAVCLYVIANDAHLTDIDVIRWCRESLTGYKVPHKVVFVEDLPRSPVGKVLRRELRELHRSQFEQGRVAS